MGILDWISNQIDEQIKHIQRREQDRLAAEKVWLANPYGMDPELQKRLVAEATKKREDDMAAQLAQHSQPSAQFEEHRAKVAEYNTTKTRQEEERKKNEKLFGARRQERITEQLARKVLENARRQVNITVSADIKSPPTSTQEDTHILAPMTNIPPVSTSTTFSPDVEDPPESMDTIIARIQAVKSLGDFIRDFQNSSAAKSLPSPVTLPRNPIPGSLNFLRNDVEFLQIRDAIQQQPELLAPFIERVKAGNPQLAMLLFHNEEEFRQLMADTSPTVPDDLKMLDCGLKLLRLRQEVQGNQKMVGLVMQRLVADNVSQTTILACNQAHFIVWLNASFDIPNGPTTIVPSLNTNGISQVHNHIHPESNLPADLSFLRSNVDFLKIRATYQAKPEMLGWLSKKFIAAYPHLKSIITSNEDQFLHMMNEGLISTGDVANEMESMDLDDSGSLPPLAQRIRQASGNATRNSRSRSRSRSTKKVSFSESAIRGDNNMDFS